MNKKVIAVALALVLVVTACVAGTLAWLTAKTDAVVNTFTTSGIDITLDETKGTKVGDDNNNRTFKMVPGETLEKDPKVTVLNGSEKCYLFVKVNVENNTYPASTTEVAKTYLTYSVDTIWTALSGVDGVYYQIVESSTADQSFYVLTDNEVSVSGDVNGAMMEAAKTNPPKMTFTAYATQYQNGDTFFTPAEAWEKVGN